MYLKGFDGARFTFSEFRVRPKHVRRAKSVSFDAYMYTIDPITYFKISKNNDRCFENGFCTRLVLFVCLGRRGYSKKVVTPSAKLRNTFSQNTGRFFR